MNITLKNIIPRKFAEDIVTTQYTSLGCKTVIDKFSVTNASLATTTISIYLPVMGDTPGLGNVVILAKSIKPAEVISFFDLVGQSLEDGGFIATIASNPSAIVLSATGRQIT